MSAERIAEGRFIAGGFRSGLDEPVADRRVQEKNRASLIGHRRCNLQGKEFHWRRFFFPLFKRSVVSFESVSPDDPERKAFSRLHGISMIVNLVVLLEGAALIVGGDWFRR